MNAAYMAGGSVAYGYGYSCLTESQALTSLCGWHLLMLFHVRDAGNCQTYANAPSVGTINGSCQIPRQYILINTQFSLYGASRDRCAFVQI